ncbi:MAG: HAD family hydrolase [Nocardioidaceae bacterium]
MASSATRPTEASRPGTRSERAGEAAARNAQVVRNLQTPPDEQAAAAFFDVDNTVMQGAAIFHLARGLHRREFFTTRVLLKAAWDHAYFRLIGIENPGAVANARESALSIIAGHRVAELESLAEEIFDEVMAGKIWPGTQALAQMHLDQGQRVWLVTAAPAEIARIIARRLGLTGALGTVAEQAAGVYTGRLVGELLHGPAKAAAVLALARREHLDLARCSAYSDSHNDLPMLSLVGDPCAINPDRLLRDHARRHGWRVRDYRTGRKAARLGLVVAGCVGAASGSLAAAIAVRRKLGDAYRAP